MGGAEDEGRAPFVLGQQMADARAAEEQHESARTEPSPLAGVAYRSEAGEHDLAFFRPSPTDEVVRGVLGVFRELDEAGRTRFRAALAMDDLYTVLHFIPRAGLQALRDGDPDLAFDAVLAAAVVDIERVDPRDLLWAMSIAAHLATITGIDESEALRAAADLAPAEVAERLLGEADREHLDLGEAGLAVVVTADGPGLVDRSFEEFAPVTDLAGCALSFARVLDADRYQATVKIGESAPPVWFRGGADAKVARVLGRCRGVAIVSGDIRPSVAAEEAPMWQHFMVLLIEARSTSDAERLAVWSSAPTDDPATLAVQVGPLLALVVNRSTLVGGVPLESATTLRRFETPLRDLLGNALADVDRSGQV
jgi:hypothetical protein